MNLTIRKMKNAPFVMYLFLGIQTAVFLYTQIAGFLMYGSGENGELLVNIGAMYAPYVCADFWGNAFRFITPIFIHIGFMHFALNSITLYFFGAELEKLYGHKRFAIIYLLSGFLGNAASFALNNTAIAAGASSSLFGIFGAFIVLKRYFPHNPAISQFSQSLIVLVVLNIGISFMDPAIDLWAHLGGFLGGGFIAITCAIPHHSDKYNIHERIIATLLFLFFAVVFILYGLKMGSF